MSPLIKNIFIAVVLAAVLFFGYRIFFGGSDELLTAEDALVTSAASRDTQEFLLRLQQLRNLDLDQSLFSDERFQSLVDYRQEIIDEPVGRANPFAPVQ